jgi:hypothetical protein
LCGGEREREKKRKEEKRKRSFERGWKGREEEVCIIGQKREYLRGALYLDKDTIN